MANLPFDITQMLAKIEAAVRSYPKAALFALAGEGYRSPFEILVACIISIRTRDETTLAIAHSLFPHARTPAELLRLSEAEVDRLIGSSTFHGAKARQLRAIALRANDEFGGEVPCKDASLRSFVGVGPKCANLVLGISCGMPRVSADVHVHRITNRWGYVVTKTPEETMPALSERVPRDLWTDINRLLVPFGKHVCTGRLPHCSTCPVLVYCRQVGITAHR